MHGPRRQGPPPADPKQRKWLPHRGYLAAAVVVAGASLLGWWASSPESPPAGAVSTAVAVTRPPEPAAPLAVAAATSAVVPSVPPRAASLPLAPAPVAAPQISRTRDPDGDQTPDLSDYVNPGEHPTVAEAIDRLHRAGVYGGLGAFSPPGTRPPLIGLAVPDDSALPPGYVRHYQATDDGQRIEPILMFSPDRPPVDAMGRPIAIPPDRVVPPELAPPGLPLRRIVVPEPAKPGGPGR